MTPAPDNTPRRPEDDLERTLARQADRFAQRGSTLQLDQVLDRAGEIRRGRRMRATMAMAAVVLAVAVPVGITTLNENNPTAPNKPQVADSAKPAETDYSPLALEGLESGDAPSNGYYAADKLYTGDKTLPLADVNDLARIDGGYLVGRLDESGVSTASFVDDDGSESAPFGPYSVPFTVSADRQIGAFIGPDGVVRAVEGGEEVEVGTLPAGDIYTTVAVTGSSCIADDCTVYVNESSDPQKVWAVPAGGEPTELGGGFIKLTGATGDVLLGQVSYDFRTGGSCWQATDEQLNQLWETCEYAFRELSPNGQYVIAVPPDTDGPGSSSVQVLDARTGKLVLDLKAADRETTGYDVVWEDDDHLLATLVKGLDSAAVRIDLNGNREYAIGVTKSSEDLEAPFELG